MRRVFLLTTMVVAGATLFAAPTALAASPQDIRKDLADNGRLDERYTQAEIDAALRDPSAAIYPLVVSPTESSGPGTDDVLSTGVLGAEAQGNVLGAEAEQGSLPFTGAELALFGLAGVALVASGLLMRSASRNRS